MPLSGVGVGSGVSLSLLGVGSAVGPDVGFGVSDFVGVAVGCCVGVSLSFVGVSVGAVVPQAASASSISSARTHAMILVNFFMCASVSIFIYNSIIAYFTSFVKYIIGFFARFGQKFTIYFCVKRKSVMIESHFSPVRTNLPPLKVYKRGRRSAASCFRAAS